MDSYKLTYFDLRGIVEPVRLLFKYVNVPFEDNRIDIKTWNDVKKDYKWHQLPILEYNGKTLTQCGAIGNFLARKFKLVPDELWEQAKCEEIIGAVHDLRLNIKPLIIAKMAGNMERAEELRKEILANTVPSFLKNLNELLEELGSSHGSGKGERTDFILGGEKPTWADFNLAHFTDQWADTLKEPNLLEPYKLLKKQQVLVFSQAGVAEWIAERPKTFV